MEMLGTGGGTVCLVCFDKPSSHSFRQFCDESNTIQRFQLISTKVHHC